LRVLCAILGAAAALALALRGGNLRRGAKGKRQHGH
jgi:hypothetical protein